MVQDISRGCQYDHVIACVRLWEREELPLTMRVVDGQVSRCSWWMKYVPTCGGGVSELPRPQDSSLGIEVEVAPRWPHCRYLPASTTTVASQHLRLTSKGKAMTIVREDSVTVFVNSREVAIEPTTR